MSLRRGVEPLDEQTLDVQRVALHFDRDSRLDLRKGDDGRQRMGRLLECLRYRCTPSLHADVDIVRDMRPSGLALGEMAELLIRATRASRAASLCSPAALFRPSLRRM